jgi:site-specific DNA-methyltransferase (adenine-specific)
MQQQIGNATLYLGDCAEILPTLGHFDAVVTDPPYGLNIANQPFKHQRKNGAEKKDWDENVSDVLYDCLKLGKKQVVWGGNYYTLPISRGWLVWHKPDGPPSFSKVELAWTNIDKLAGYFLQTIGATNPERVGHPTQKPLKLMEWCIDYIGECKTILDPFMGSGTTGVACVNLKKQFVGIEREPKYFDIACKRIEDAQRQQQLF